ncbi:hypothetical protein FOA52_002767 [Chlamydomonas sp. UWO 241]|nr:hypothetical protein FOA52_002767 [Chlamydomonas sp. UWO 241]
MPVGGASMMRGAGDTRRVTDKSTRLDSDGDSMVSFGTGPAVAAKKVANHKWAPGAPGDKVNHETFHRMLDEHRDSKRRELDLELKCKQLAAQLARTEEAAKRSLVQSDPSARGGAAQRLLDAERALSKLRDENAELRSKWAREKKKVADMMNAHTETKQRLENSLRDQRGLAKRVGEVERKNSMLSRKPEDEFWGEEAGRRFVVQQEELVQLREENAGLRKQVDTAEGISSGGGGVDGGHDSMQSQLSELQALVAFYEKKIGSLAEQQTISPQNDVPGGPNSDDWILEEHVINNEVFLLDRKSGKLFTNPGQGTYPRAVGMRTGLEVKMGTQSKMQRFLDTLDHFMQTNTDKLSEAFNEFDLDGSGFLDRRELARMIEKLMPDATPRDVEELRTMLDQDGDGQITLPELEQTIKEAFEARTAAKIGKSLQVNELLERVRNCLRGNKKIVREVFDEIDADHDGTLYHMEIVRMIKRLLPDMYQKEVRFLLAKLQEFDTAGEGKVSLDELYQALELATVYKVGQGRGGLAMPASPGRTTSRGAATSTIGGGPGSPGMGAKLRQSAGAGLKDGFMRERVWQLESELKGALEKESMLESEAKQVHELRRELSAYKARVEDLHRDFMRVETLGRQGEADLQGDDKLKQAWETASMFKKRYMEHKAELDSIKVTYARMQSQLDETHKLLNDEHRRRFQLEDDATRLNMELARIKDLEARLGQERVQRVKLEREYMSLQDRAFNAPGAQLVELRQLQDETFALRRAKAVAEKKEVEVRHELGLVREQLDGMSLEQYRGWQREHADLKRRIVDLELELQAAADKLEVYKRTQPPAMSDVLLGGERGESSLFRGDQRPDTDKNSEELRVELVQLRDVWRLDRDELKKVHAVLEVEEGKCMEARAALEEAHREMERLRRDYTDQLRTTQRELENRDERIRRLEVQLRGAYMGVNNAIRSGVRDSQLTSDPDDMSDVGENQNLLELHISDASVYEEALGKDPSTFFTVDFFMHETQATSVIASNAPGFNTVLQYVVEQEPFTVEYLDTHVLELELNRARGWDYDPVGVARIPLRQILDDVDIGNALGANVSWHHVDVYGADGRRVARVRYGFRFRRPLDGLVRQYREFARSKRPSEPDARDPATVAVEAATATPRSASYVKVHVAGCKDLLPPGRTGAACRPYVHYRFPGHKDPHTTKALHGLNPVYRDEATWLMARTPEMEANFKTREMQVFVFDDAGGDDPSRGIIGVAFVPLGALSSGTPVEGAFRLINPVTRQEAGQVVLGIGWHNPLRLPGEAPPPQQRSAGPTPGDVAAMAGRAGAPHAHVRPPTAGGSAQQQHPQQHFQQGQQYQSVQQQQHPHGQQYQQGQHRGTGDSDISLAGYAGGGGRQSPSSYGLGAEVGAAAARTPSVPLDEFGVPLRPCAPPAPPSAHHGGLGAASLPSSYGLGAETGFAPPPAAIVASMLGAAQQLAGGYGLATETRQPPPTSSSIIGSMLSAGVGGAPTGGGHRGAPQSGGGGYNLAAAAGGAPQSAVGYGPSADATRGSGGSGGYAPMPAPQPPIGSSYGLASETRGGAPPAASRATYGLSSETRAGAPATAAGAGPGGTYGLSSEVRTGAPPPSSASIIGSMLGAPRPLGEGNDRYSGLEQSPGSTPRW